ncbi:ankyrin repeat domain-containing protein 55-like isoform X4 [Ostrea edulis]|uniref:ankyrin repeat domain-containing protein 55-like isoform X4 n=1 Tax=Ostrea edulis TaxID=37623 RepID=UPI0024AF252E|nr:ankyrin repeat domain-containing protein 55-like isoform X4 [Ostrea edulis]
MDFDSDAYLDNIAEGSDAEVDNESQLPAHKAASKGEIIKLVKAIQHDPSSLELEDSDGLTPLGHAVKSKELEAVKQIIKMGGNINTKDCQGRTPLALATYQGWFEGVIYLLRKGAKQGIAEKSGRTPLHASTYDKDVRIIGALLQTLSKEEVAIQDNEKMTALHWAAFHNRPEHLQLLLMSGANMHCQDIDGKTPLHWASEKGSVECCHLLLQCCKGPKLVNQLDNSNKNALHYAAAAGHYLLLRELVGVEGVDLEAEDPDDRTPLHWAAAMGHSQCVSVLLNMGVTPNPSDIEGGTPLDYAKQTGHRECVRLLEEKMGIKASNITNRRPKVKKSESTRNPFGKLKDLFRPRNRKVSSTPTSDANSDSIEMRSYDKQSGTTSMSNSERSLKELTRREESRPASKSQNPENQKKSPVTPSNVTVPKIVLSTFEEKEDDQVLLKQRKSRPRRHKKKRLHKQASATTTFEENYDLHTGKNLHKDRSRRDNQHVNMGTSNLLPPVMSPKVSPLPPSPIPQDLPRTPPPHKTPRDLAPLRVPQIKSAGTQPIPILQTEEEDLSSSTSSPPYSNFRQMDSGLYSPVPQLSQEHLHRHLMTETRPPHQATSPWLQVQPAPRDIFERRLSGSSQASTTPGVTDHLDFLSVSSGQRSRLSSISQSPIPSGQRSRLSSVSQGSARSDVSVRLTSITPTHYGSPKSVSMVGSPSPPHITQMEKRTMDRRIHSLLH